MSTSQLERWQRYIVLAHVALAVLFGVIIPPWEAHDETGHFAYVNQLVAQHSLPDARGNDKVFLDQSHQPPLYYLVVAGLTFWIDRSDQVSPQINLFAFDGTNRRGTRILLRNPGEAFPWQGTILAIHAARLVSTLLSAVMLLLIARTARLLFQELPSAALLTTAIAAFNPQVLFMAGMVNNDIMISLTGAALAYLIVSLIQTSITVPKSQPPNPKSPISNPQSPISRFILIGLVLALCLWSKNSGLILIPFTTVALLYLAWRQRWLFGQLIVRGAVTSTVTLAVAGPFYLSNKLRYGQWIVDRAAENPLVQAPTSLISTGLAVSLRDGWLPQIFINAFRTFWGTFGWGNVQMPDGVYTIMAALVLLGGLGCIIGLRRAGPPMRDGLVIIILLAIAMVLLPGYRAFFYQSPTLLPGRYLMPGLVAYAGIVGFGWVLLGREIGRSAWRLGIRDWRFEIKSGFLRNLQSRISNLSVSQFITVLLAVAVVLVPFGVIAPAYALPAIQKTPDTTPALLTFEDVVQVTSVNAETTYLQDREGQRHYAHVRITWRALKRTTENYAFGISILGRDAEVLGNLNVEPARGAYPSTNWNRGDTFEDEYYVLLEKPCARLPALGRVNVSVYEFKRVEDQRNTIAMSITHQLQARDGEGRAVAPIVGRFRIDEPLQPMAVFWQPPLGAFDNIALRQINMPADIQAGTAMTIQLTYEVWGGSSVAGNAFVHVYNERGIRVAQDDHVPLMATYPTDMWQPGECIDDTFALRIPITATGTLRAVTGFYSPVTGVRFHTGTQDDLFPLGQVRVR
jgi:hypothetical protein